MHVVVKALHQNSFRALVNLLLKFSAFVAGGAARAGVDTDRGARGERAAVGAPRAACGGAVPRVPARQPAH